MQPFLKNLNKTVDMDQISQTDRRVVKSQYDESINAAKDFRNKQQNVSKTQINSTNVYVESYQQMNSKQEAVIQAERDQQFVDRQHQFIEEKLLSQQPKQLDVTSSPNKIQCTSVPENKRKKTRSSSRRSVSREKQNQRQAQVRFQLAEQDSPDAQKPASDQVPSSTGAKLIQNQKEDVKVYPASSHNNVKKYIERIQQLEEEVRLLREQNQQYEQEKKALKRQINEQYLQIRKYKKMEQNFFVMTNQKLLAVNQDGVQ